jgi:hypothetical protein
VGRLYFEYAFRLVDVLESLTKGWRFRRPRCRRQRLEYAGRRSEVPSPTIWNTLAGGPRCRRRRFGIRWPEIGGAVADDLEYWPEVRGAVRCLCEGNRGERRRGNRHRSDIWRFVDGFDVRPGRSWRLNPQAVSAEWGPQRILTTG